MKSYKMHCEILSPLHIGTGDELTPLDYIINEKDNMLYKVSFGRLVNLLDEKKSAQLEKLIDAGNLIEIRSFVSGLSDIQKYSLFSVEVTNGIKVKYRTKIKDIQNQLLIQPFIRTEGGVIPLIPGSSIKGSVRTAIISDLANKLKVRKPSSPYEEYEFEKTVLGYQDAKSDPFRGLKVRDKTLLPDATIIREIMNVFKDRQNNFRSNDMQQYTEVTHSRISGAIVEFDTEIIFDDELFKTGFLSKTLSKDDIVRSCKTFYNDKLNAEHKKFYKNSPVEQNSSELIKASIEASHDPNSFLLRVGRFSGVESVTIDNYRSPKPPWRKRVG